MAKRRGLGNINAANTSGAIREISNVLMDIDSDMAKVPSARPISGYVDGAGVAVVQHGLGRTPDEVVVITHANANWYTTFENRQSWNSKTVAISFSGACKFTGFVISY